MTKAAFGLSSSLLVLALAATALTGAQAQQAAMLLPGSINDQSWNAQGYAGLTKLKEIGYEIAYSENVPAADHVEAMRDYARRGFTLVIGHSGRFLSAAQRVGPEFPKVQFVAGSGAGGQGQNVMSVDYNNAQFGCLLGTLMARASKSGKIGGVYALEGLPNVVAQVGGMRLCAKQARPEIEVNVVYIKDIEDAAAAKEAAYALIGGGADVLTGKLNAAQAGLIQAAKDKGVFVTGRSFGHTAIAPEVVLTNIIEQWPTMYASVAADVKQNKLAGEYKVYGFDTSANGAMLRLTADSAFNSAVSQDTIAELDKVSKRFTSGELKLVPTREDARPGK
jgi:basic membrane protein A and related proteins